MDTLEYWRDLSLKLEKVIETQSRLIDALEVLVAVYKPPVFERPRLTVVRNRKGDSCES